MRLVKKQLHILKTLTTSFLTAFPQKWMQTLDGQKRPLKRMNKKY